MAHPYFHAASSARKFGGLAFFYLPAHAFFDETKAHCHNVRHRALRHSVEGIALAGELLGETIFNGVEDIATEKIGVQHVMEDCGFVPHAADWLRRFRAQPWMEKAQHLTTQEAADASAQKYGGSPDSYLCVHAFLDQVGNDLPGMAIRHHGEGIFLAERKFGVAVTNSQGREVPVRFLGEFHMMLHFRKIPTVTDWLYSILLQDWMRGAGENLEHATVLSV